MKKYVNQIIFRDGDGIFHILKRRIFTQFGTEQTVQQRNAWNDFRRIVFHVWLFEPLWKAIYSILLNCCCFLLLFPAIPIYTIYTFFTLLRKIIPCYCCFAKLFFCFAFLSRRRLRTRDSNSLSLMFWISFFRLSKRFWIFLKF